MSVEKAIYNLRQAIEITGVSEFLLRIWENRYQAVTPHRTNTGRRLYTGQEIEKISLLYQLTQRKHYRISQVSHLTVTQLKKIHRQQMMTQDSSVATSLENRPQDPNWLTDFFEAIFLEKWELSQRILLKKNKTLKNKDKIFKLILPILQKMSKLVQDNSFTIAQEHIVTAFIKDLLHAECAAQNQRPQSYKIVSQKECTQFLFSTFEDDHHDLGLLMARTLALYHNMKTLYLGPHIPINELLDVCVKFNIQHLVISTTPFTNSKQTTQIIDHLTRLLENGPPKMKIFIAGANSSRFSFIHNSRFKIISNFEEFNQLIHQIKQKEIL